MLDTLYYMLPTVKPEAPTYSAELAGTTYETTEPSLLFPNAILAYKQDDWAAFFTFTVPGGGGTIKYKDGSPSVMALANGTVIPGLPGGNTLTANALEATSMYLCYTLGGAYKINNMISFALAGRYITATTTQKPSFTIHSILGAGVTGDIVADAKLEDTATGYGYTIGVNLTPAQGFNIGIRFESRVAMEFETSASATVDRQNGTAAWLGLTETLPATLVGTLKNMYDGKKSDLDMPATFAIGMSYMVMPNVRVEGSFVTYFNSQADWDGAERFISNGYDTGFAVEYTVMPGLKASIGYLYSNSGANPENYDIPENPNLDSNTVALGAAYDVIPGLTVNLGASRTFYSGITTADGTNMKLEKVAWNIALGLNYRLGI